MSSRAPQPGAALPDSPGFPPAHSTLPPEWFHAHFERIWRLVARLGVGSGYVDDVVQEVFITASRRREAILPGQECRYLMAVAVRLAANHRRRAFVRRERAVAELPELGAQEGIDVEQALVLKRRQAQLAAVLSLMSQAHREVLVLYELERQEVVEIAKILEVPIGTVKSRLARARDHFLELVTSMRRASTLEEAP